MYMCICHMLWTPVEVRRGNWFPGVGVKVKTKLWYSERVISVPSCQAISRAPINIYFKLECKPIVFL